MVVQPSSHLVPVTLSSGILSLTPTKPLSASSFYMPQHTLPPSTSILLAPVTPSATTSAPPPSSSVVIPSTEGPVQGASSCTWSLCHPLYIGLAAGGAVFLVMLIAGLAVFKRMRKRRMKRQTHKQDLLSDENTKVGTPVKGHDESENLIVMNSYTTSSPRKHTLSETDKETPDIVYQNMSSTSSYQPLRHSNGQDSPEALTFPQPTSRHITKQAAPKRYDSSKDTTQLLNSRRSDPPKIDPREEAIMDAQANTSDVFYEVMENKTLPRETNMVNNSEDQCDSRGRANIGYRETDEPADLVYEVMEDKDKEENIEEDVFYDNMDGRNPLGLTPAKTEGIRMATSLINKEPEYDTFNNFEDHQLNYEIMGEAMHNTDGPQFTDVQLNYEIMDKVKDDAETHPNYEIMSSDLTDHSNADEATHELYEVMGDKEEHDQNMYDIVPNEDPEEPSEMYETMNQEDQPEYDIPVIVEDTDSSYVPDFGDNAQYQDENGANGGKKSSADEEYIYADVPNTEGKNILKQFQQRKSWQPINAVPVPAGAKRNSTNSMPAQYNIDGSDALYTLAKDTLVPKCLPSLQGKLKGSTSLSELTRDRLAVKQSSPRTRRANKSLQAPLKPPSSSPRPSNTLPGSASGVDYYGKSLPPLPQEEGIPLKPVWRGGDSVPAENHSLGDKSNIQFDDYSNKSLPPLPKESCPGLSSEKGTYPCRGNMASFSPVNRPKGGGIFPEVMSENPSPRDKRTQLDNPEGDDKKLQSKSPALTRKTNPLQQSALGVDGQRSDGEIKSKSCSNIKPEISKPRDGIKRPVSGDPRRSNTEKTKAIPILSENKPCSDDVRGVDDVVSRYPSSASAETGCAVYMNLQEIKMQRIQTSAGAASVADEELYENVPRIKN
ncbi:uncharacterized protein LOC116617581 isoform X2 [Nematostella vectensis]|nr:uncharacterized protein LOC116617581 isoform X2 [Nematostella vectensis]